MRRRDRIVWALVFKTDNDNSRLVPCEVVAPGINCLADSITKWPAELFGIEMGSRVWNPFTIQQSLLTEVGSTKA